MLNFIADIFIYLKLNINYFNLYINIININIDIFNIW